MHIQFELGLQKLGSLSRRKFYYQEIDNLLNMAVDQFIRDSIRVEEDEHGFQRLQIDVDRLRPLIIRDYKIAAQYVETLRNYKEYIAVLPSNYSYLVSDTWYQQEVCSTNTSATQTQYLFAIPIKDSPKGSAKFYETMKLQLYNGTTVVTLVDLETDTQQGPSVELYLGYDNKSEKFSAVELLQSVFHRKFANGDYSSSPSSTVSGLYYERYGGYYYPNHLLLITSQSAYYPRIVVDIDTTDVTTPTKTVSFVQHSDTSGYDVDPARLTRESALDNILSTPFYKPLKHSPVSALDSNVLHLYSHTNRIVNKGSVTYVRKPQKIDLTLQLNCELAPEFHQKIVDMAVEYAAGRLEQEKLYQITAIENQKK